MRRADPQELREDARPALLLALSESRLRELFPVDFSPVESEPEPSHAALVQLMSGAYVVVMYGTITRRATVSFPVSADVHDAIESLLREVPLQSAEILWTADAPHRVGAR
ncbi:MAG TPA: hypothetical protein VF266_14545 [Thermoanaerobaculia bacterium]